MGTVGSGAGAIANVMLAFRAKGCDRAGSDMLAQMGEQDHVG